MTPAEQLDLWVDGQSIHNDERGECCPDFSCCLPQLLWDVDDRRTFKKYYKSNDGFNVDSILIKSLSNMLMERFK